MTDNYLRPVDHRLVSVSVWESSKNDKPPGATGTTQHLQQGKQENRHMSTPKCAALPHDLQHVLVFFRLSQVVRIVVIVASLLLGGNTQHPELHAALLGARGSPRGHLRC